MLLLVCWCWSIVTFFRARASRWRELRAATLLAHAYEAHKKHMRLLLQKLFSDVIEFKNKVCVELVLHSSPWRKIDRVSNRSNHNIGSYPILAFSPTRSCIQTDRFATTATIFLQIPTKQTEVKFVSIMMYFWHAAASVCHSNLQTSSPPDIFKSFSCYITRKDLQHFI